MSNFVSKSFKLEPQKLHSDSIVIECRRWMPNTQKWLVGVTCGFDGSLIECHSHISKSEVRILVSNIINNNVG